jgi:hypothetical protein
VPNGAEIEAPPGVDFTVAVLARAVLLSGQLDDAQSLDELCDAVDHFDCLLASVVTTAAVPHYAV